MAFLDDIKFTGRLGDLTAYKMKGTNKIVLRRRGGPKKEDLNHSPTFALNRLHRREFGATATLSKHLRFMLGNHQAVSNYNISATLNSVLKHVKRQDTVGELGKRALRLSSVPTLLNGFSLNEHITFDTILHTGVEWSLSRETYSAAIQVPELIRQYNFFPRNQQPYFTITAALGAVPDIVYNETRGAYGPPEWFDGMYVPVQVSSPWYPAQQGSPAATLSLDIKTIPPDDQFTLILSIGVRFAAIYENNKVQLLESMGAAKILGTM